MRLAIVQIVLGALILVEVVLAFPVSVFVIPAGAGSAQLRHCSILKEPEGLG